MGSKGKYVSNEELETLAREVRESVLGSRAARRGDSEPVAAALASRLASIGVEAKIVRGSFMGQPHAWVRADCFSTERCVDATRDQFALEPGVDDPAHYLNAPVVVARGMMVTPGRTQHPSPVISGDVPPGDPRQDAGFQQWFKRSVIVDADGCPLRMYHGSPHDFDRFDVEKVKEADTDAPVGGFWFAAHRGTANYGPFVKEFYLSIQNPADYFDAEQAYRAVAKRGEIPNTKAVQAELTNRGFDGYAHHRLMAFRPEEVARWQRFIEHGEAVEYRPGMVAKGDDVDGGVSYYNRDDEGDHHVTGYESLQETLSADTTGSGIYVAFSPEQIMPTSLVRGEAQAERSSSVGNSVADYLPDEQRAEREPLCL